ncbi:MAG TPA: riboflavin synthase [Rhizomicrobium sp.]|jgi:riboflavin synthase|nr:riboflavin synthase [Rhizomicrobium sp.]
MFTGIVSDIGEVRRIESRGDLHIIIATRFDVGAIEIGASIACAGICLTVTDKGGANDRWFEVSASHETQSKTTAGTWKIGHGINLERPLRVGDELGGHIVTGHVDGTAAILEMIGDGESMRMVFEAPPAVTKYVASKGSISLDGVSLTVNEVDGARFGINLIPHTLKATTFGRSRQGDFVNIEVDILARYVARLMG